MYFIAWLVVGALAGWVFGRIAVHDGESPLADVAMGALGAVAGGGFVEIATRTMGEVPPVGGLIAALLVSIVVLGVYEGMLHLRDL